MYTFKDLENQMSNHPMDKELAELYTPYPNVDTIQKAETILNISFPEDYKKSLLQWGIIFVKSFMIYGICGNDVNYTGGPNVIELTKDSREYAKLPEYYLAIHDEEGDEVWCIDTRKVKGPVIAWDCFNHEVVRILADSYLSFIIDLLKD